MAVNLTPLEEYNKALVQQKRDLEKQTQSLRTPFKQLVSTVAETNAEFAKIASENIGQTQDTWKGLITQGKKERLIRQAHTEEFKAHNKAIKESQKRELQIKLDNEKNEAALNQKILAAKEEVARKEAALEATTSSQKDRLDKIEIDRKTLQERIINEKNSKAQDHFQRQLDSLNAQEGQLLKISAKREEELKLAQDNQSNQNLLSEKSMKEGEQRLVDEQQGRRESAIIVSETNEKLEHELDKASNTEGFDKFTGSIKTLTGGLVDIEGILDPVSKYVGAFRDLGSMIGSPLAGVKNSFNEFKGMLQASTEKGEESSEALKESNESVAEMVADSSKKTSFGFGKLVKNIGLTGIALLALVAGVIALMNRFEGFDRFIKGLLGFEDTPDQTKTEFDELSDADKSGDKGQELIDQQEDRVESLEFKEDVLDKSAEATGIFAGGARSASAAISATPTASRSLTTAVREGIDLAGDATRLNSAGQRIDDAGRFVKDATKVQKVTNAASQVVQTGGARTTASVMKHVASKAAAPVAVLLTGAEVMRKLQESDDMAATLEEMRANEEITEQDYQKGLELIEEKKKEDVVRPVAATTAGVAASAAAASAAAPLLAAGPFGWLAYGAIVIGSGVVASLAADKIVDSSMTADDEINEILGDNSYDVNDAKEDLKEMKTDVKDIENRQGQELESKQNDLQEVGSQVGTTVVSTSVNTQNSETLTVGDTPAQNQDTTAAALAATG